MSAEGSKADIAEFVCDVGLVPIVLINVLARGIEQY
jgi:hypothetical protein